MRILCDHNVEERYYRTFRRTDWITATTVREELSPGATDLEIGQHATVHDWIVFTEDDDYLAIEMDRGVVLYHQNEKPSPETVLIALCSIAEAYADHREIREFVPGEWA